MGPISWGFPPQKLHPEGMETKPCFCKALIHHTCEYQGEPLILIQTIQQKLEKIAENDPLPKSAWVVFARVIWSPIISQISSAPLLATRNGKPVDVLHSSNFSVPHCATLCHSCYILLYLAIDAAHLRCHIPTWVRPPGPWRLPAAGASWDPHPPDCPRSPSTTTGSDTIR